MLSDDSLASKRIYPGAVFKHVRKAQGCSMTSGLVRNSVVRIDVWLGTRRESVHRPPPMVGRGTRTTNPRTTNRRCVQRHIAETTSWFLGSRPVSGPSGDVDVL